ncbi:MAG: hypothetical protein M3R54_09455, partial [Chloroflexota bacterium]|nr:hypothetical protein [Chloroflexota bacterium]
MSSPRPVDDHAALADLQLRLSKAALIACEHPRALKAALDARGHFEVAGDVRRTGEALHQLALCYSSVGDTAATNETALEAVRLLEPFGDGADLAAAYAVLAREALLDCRLSDAIRFSERALEIAQRGNAIAEQVHALTTSGFAMTLQGDSEGLAKVRDSLALALEHDLGWPCIRTNNLLWASLFVTGRPDDELLAVYQRGQTLAHRHSYVWGTTEHDLQYAFDEGDWDRALQLANTYPDEPGEERAQLVAACIHAARSGLTSSAHIDAVLRRLHGRAETQRAYGALSVQVMLLAGDLRAVIDHAEGVVDFLGDGHWRADVDVAVVSALFAAVWLGERPAAVRWEQLELSGRSQESRSKKGRRAYVLAERAARLGEVQRALELFAESAERFKGVGGSLVGQTLPRLRRAECLLLPGPFQD